MRLKLAPWLCLALSFGVAQAQTPGTFAPNSQLGSTQLNAAFGAKANATNPVITGTLTLGGVSATGIGTGIGQIPQIINYNGSGFPGLHIAGQRLIIDQANPAPGDFAVLQLNRTTTFTGGTGLFSNVLRVIGSSGAGDATNNWGITSTMSTSGNSGGETTAGFFQTRALAGSTDFNITGISDYRDETNLGTLASGTSGGGAHEFDLEANGPDDGINALSLGGVGVRKMQHLVAVRLNAANTAQTEVSHAIWGSTQQGASGPADAHTNFGSFIGFSKDTQIRNGLDTRLAIPPAGSANPVAAVTMKAGHVIDFNGSGSSITAAPGNYWWYDTATSKMKYNVGATTVTSIDASGNVRALGTVTASVTP